VALSIPARVAAACQATPERAAWLQRLPETLRDVERRWSLRLEPAFDGDDVSCALVMPAVGADGASAILKLAMPHFEGRDEIGGLIFWNGDPTVRLLQADADAGVMLIERCSPGTPLRARPDAEQERVIAPLLRRLWRRPPPSGGFRPLAAMTALWSDETRAQSAFWPDAGLVREGLRLLRDLAAEAPDTDVLLATDLHAGNVLRAQREPWLVIDPKPFVGDPAYDATQHLLNGTARLRSEGIGAIHRFADRLAVDPERVRLWTFARLAAEPRDDWRDGSLDLARQLAP
jgi:streptomycin 6-kinase